MQSSTIVALRALVMLVCVVAIPLAAILGGSLPDIARTFLDDYWPKFSESAGKTANLIPWSGRTEPALVQADPFEENCPSAARLRRSQPADGSLSEVVPAAYETTTTETAVSGTVLPDYIVKPPDDGLVTCPSTPLVGRPGNRPMPLPSSTGGEPVVGERFTHIQNRLRELGATRYLLEYWGNQGQLYRFYCRVSIAGSPNYTRYFEETDSDPLRAMSGVLEQVERWRAGQQEGGTWQGQSRG